MLAYGRSKSQCRRGLWIVSKVETSCTSEHQLSIQSIHSTFPWKKTGGEEKEERKGKGKEKWGKERRCEGEMGGKQGENEELTGNGR